MSNSRLYNINIYCNLTIYLSPNQYILEDAIYTSTKYMILFYKALKVNYSKNYTFNN